MGKFLHSNHVMGTENMEILKVVIADDEVRICQLIQALIDWGFYGNEGGGNRPQRRGSLRNGTADTAGYSDHRYKDAVYGRTGIKPPGEKSLPKTRIIILSGYNEFEYAKEAIKIGSVTTY